MIFHLLVRKRRAKPKGVLVVTRHFCFEANPEMGKKSAVGSINEITLKEKQYFLPISKKRLLKTPVLSKKENTLNQKVRNSKFL